MFLFQAEAKPAYNDASGIRLLLIFLLLEAVIGPRLSILDLLGLPSIAPWVRVPILLGLALFLIRFFAQLRLPQIGLSAWRDWSEIEKSYFLQTLVISNVVFSILYWSQLGAIMADPDLWGRAAVVASVNLLWGFYQELLYRGIMQTELIRRWGSVPGILASNLLFTFGPLHFYHFSASVSTWTAMFVGIFLIGLFFAVLFQSSGNLFIVGSLHGLGNCYIDGLGTFWR